MLRGVVGDFFGCQCRLENVRGITFIKDKYIVIVSNLKLRASYGETGIDAGNEFQFIEGFTMGSKGE